MSKKGTNSNNLYTLQLRIFNKSDSDHTKLLKYNYPIINFCIQKGYLIINSRENSNKNKSRKNNDGNINYVYSESAFINLNKGTNVIVHNGSEYIGIAQINGEEYIEGEVLKKQLFKFLNDNGRDDLNKKLKELPHKCYFARKVTWIDIGAPRLEDIFDSEKPCISRTIGKVHIKSIIDKTEKIITNTQKLKKGDY